MIVGADLLTAAGVAPATAAAWAGPLTSACLMRQITSPLRRAGFLVNILHETANLSTLRENLNYTDVALMQVFGRTGRITQAQATLYGRTKAHEADQQAIANTIYGGAFGLRELGNTQPGDGWLCRGVGPIQQTGRSNLVRFANAIGWTGSIAALADYLATPDGGSQGSASFWQHAGCNEIMDTGNITAARVKVNGGTIGLSDVLARFPAILRLCGGALPAAAQASHAAPAAKTTADLNDTALAAAKAQG